MAPVTSPFGLVKKVVYKTTKMASATEPAIKMVERSSERSAASTPKSAWPSHSSANTIIRNVKPLKPKINTTSFVAHMSEIAAAPSIK